MTSGFSLPELLVSVVIIVLITTIIIYNQGDFNDRISLSNAASDIELQIREAQVYGISVREFQPAGDFTSAYGVTFNITTSGGTPGSIGPLNFWSFIDRITKNGYYDTSTWSSCSVSPTSECLKISALTRGNVVYALYAIDSSSIDRAIGRLDITFLRPNPNALMIFRNLSNGTVTYPGYKGAKIVIQSPKGNQTTVTVFSNGQISIQ
jgi:prepilin-type N-terminal cleavage/methylation domain-containing protein